MSEPALDLGARLRAARQERGYSLHDVAAVTKIPLTSLDAIERNNFDRLPGGLFRRAYVRAFAAEVGVNPDPLPDVLLGNDPVDPDAVGRQGVRGWRHMPTAIAVLLLLAVLALLRVV